MKLQFPKDMPVDAKKAALYMALISSVIDIVQNLDTLPDEIEALEEVMTMLKLDSKQLLENQHILLTLKELCIGFSQLDLTEVTGGINN